MQIVERHTSGTLGQLLPPLLPTLTTKAFQRNAGVLSRLLLLTRKALQQRAFTCLLIEMEAADPLQCDLHITQFSQALLKLLAGLAKTVPDGIRINLGKAFRQGSRAAQSHAQIMDGLGGEFTARRVTFGQDATQSAGERVGSGHAVG